MVAITKDGLQATSHKEYHIGYMSRHTQQWTRRLHLIGTVGGAIGAVAGVVTLDPIAVGASVLGGAAVCWAGDALVEKETPSAFKHPMWAAMSNGKMVWSMVKGDSKV